MANLKGFLNIVSDSNIDTNGLNVFIKSDFRSESDTILLNMFVFAVMTQHAVRQYDRCVWTPPSVARPPAFIAAFIELTEARLLSAGGEPKLKICRYVSEHMLAAFLWLFPTWRRFGRMSRHISRHGQHTAVSMIITVSLLHYHETFHESTSVTSFCCSLHTCLSLPVDASSFLLFFMFTACLSAPVNGVSPAVSSLLKEKRQGIST